jgi:hypothetical protein
LILHPILHLANADLESELKRDWAETYTDRDWDSYRDPIHRAWDYQEGREMRKAA